MKEKRRMIEMERASGLISGIIHEARMLALREKVDVKTTIHGQVWVCSYDDILAEYLAAQAELGGFKVFKKKAEKTAVLAALESIKCLLDDVSSLISRLIQEAKK